MERCTLCGGRLANGKCTECGLDNTKNDKKYHLNTHNEKGTLLHRGGCEDHLNRDSDWRERLRKRQKRPDAAAGEGHRTNAGQIGGMRAGESGRTNAGRTGGMRAGESGRINAGRTDGMEAGQTDRTKADQSGSPGAPASQEERQSRRERMKELKMRRQTGTVREKRPLALVLIGILAILFTVCIVIGLVGSLVDSGRDSLGNMLQLVRQEFSGAEQEVPAAPARAAWDPDSEEYFELALEPGFYTVGYEIPAGSCQFVCREENADIYWWNPDGEYGGYVFLYSPESQQSYEELFEEKCPYFQYSEIVDLEEGAVVRMEGSGSETTVTGMSGSRKALRAHEPQDVKDDVILEDGMTVGEDFAAGVYDLILETPENTDVMSVPDDYMSVYIEVSATDDADPLFINVDTLYAQYLRIPFSEGSTVTVEKYSEEKDCRIRLVPSY